MPTFRPHALAALVLSTTTLLFAVPAGALPRHGSSVKRARVLRVVTIRATGGRIRAYVRWNTRVRVVRPNRLLFTASHHRAVDARLIRGRVGQEQLYVLTGGTVHALRVSVRSVRDEKTKRWVSPQTVRPAMRKPASGAPAFVPPAHRPEAGATSLPAVMPVAATRFADSVGVNVHMSYFDTTYNAWQTLRDKLRELGVHNIRDVACVGCFEQQRRLLALGRSGVKVDFVMREPGSVDSLADLVKLVAGPLRTVVGSVEGPNEYDRSGPGWAVRLRVYQQELYQRVRSSRRLDGVPVIGPSLTSADSYPELGNLSGAFDWGNVHPYAGGQVPLANLPSNLNFERQVAGPKPVAATEAGYHTALATTNGHVPASEAAAGIYVPRLFLEHFLAGVPRTFLYELVDERREDAQRDPEQHFGLLRADYSEKPAFRTLARLMALTGGASVAPVPVHLRVDGAADVHQLLLQTGSKTYALVLWRGVSVWDARTRKPLSVTPVGVQVALGSEVQGATTAPVDQPTKAPIAISGGVVRVPLAGVPTVVSLTTR